MNIAKYYRGYDKAYGVYPKDDIIFLSDDEEYAEMYSEKENGGLAYVYVDFDKLNSIDYNEVGTNFDELDPDPSVMKEYLEQGFNCYTFSTSGDSEILVLLSREPIVKVETIEEVVNRKIHEEIKRQLRKLGIV